MFIKNQQFKDEETLMEVLFDFNLGEPSVYTKELYTQIDKELEGNKNYQDYRKTLSSDDQTELDVEERDMRLAEILMAEFNSFEVQSSCLYAVKNKEKTLLFEMLLV